jgi:hypothetical protein
VGNLSKDYTENQSNSHEENACCKRLSASRNIVDNFNVDHPNPRANESILGAYTPTDHS